MSLEDKIDALTKAVEANTAALTKIGAAAKPAAASGGGKPAAAKPAASAKPKAPTIDDLRTKFGAYLSVKDADERETRKGHVQAINDYFGVAKVTELDAANYAEALAYLAQYEKGETPEFAGADEGGEDGEGESLV